ncbi:hypothetical protein KEM56_003623 [Ascosphaera pollenicola]|nr:hypothetical protein KEM56_003623 [Ascosphaera pollenicola]
MDLYKRAKHETKSLIPALTVPRSRRPRFELTLRILDLNNIPLVTGTAHVKWHLPSSNAAEHRGRTDKAPISPLSHIASWAYVKVLPVRMTVDKGGMLSSCEVHFDIYQEFTTPGENGSISGRSDKEKDKHRERDDLAHADGASVDGGNGNREHSNSNSNSNNSHTGSICTNNSQDSRSLLNTPVNPKSAGGGGGGSNVNGNGNGNAETASFSSGRRRSSVFSDRTRSRSRDRASSHKEHHNHHGNKDKEGNGGLGHSNSGKADKSLLGRVKLNLAEYVNEGREDEGVVRRYLMQDSKINSTLRIGISMRLVEGENNFITPPLKSSSVFGAITGVIAEQNEPDDKPPRNLTASPTPLAQTSSFPSASASTSASSASNREIGDLQDMYRRTLAASYVCRLDELPPDELIEDIFAGGDGFEGGWDVFAQASVARRNVDTDGAGTGASAGNVAGAGAAAKNGERVGGGGGAAGGVVGAVSGYTLYRRHGGGHVRGDSGATASAAAVRGGETAASGEEEFGYEEEGEG